MEQAALGIVTSAEPKQKEQTEEEKWREMRKGGVGASDVASILGENPYSSAYEVWAEKVGLIDDDWDGNERQDWGKKLEPLIADEYATRSKHAIVDHGRYATANHKELSCLYATVDREIVGADKGPGSLECKNTREYFAEEWETGGPMMYRLQLQTQLEVKGWDWGALAVLIGGGQFLSIEMERDHELGELILDEVDAFWELVQAGTPPPNDGSPATRSLMQRLHPKDSGLTIVMPREILPQCERWEAAKKRIRDSYREKEECESYIFEAMGDATWAKMPDGRRVQWRVQAKKAYQVQASESRVLRTVKGLGR